jgi:hypothetical protein
VQARRYWFLGSLQVLDVALTGFILHSWSERAEGNPVARFIMETTGLWVGLAILLAFKLSVVYLWYACQTGIKIASAVYSLVLVNNLIFLGAWAWLAWKGQT